MNPQGICEVCGKHGQVIRTIYAASGKVAVRCPNCLNQPEDFSKTTETQFND